jgi:hypothetical protein
VTQKRVSPDQQHPSRHRLWQSRRRSRELTFTSAGWHGGLGALGGQAVHRRAVKPLTAKALFSA